MGILQKQSYFQLKVPAKFKNTEIKYASRLSCKTVGFLFYISETKLDPFPYIYNTIYQYSYIILKSDNKIK